MKISYEITPDDVGNIQKYVRSEINKSTDPTYQGVRWFFGIMLLAAIFAIMEWSLESLCLLTLGFIMGFFSFQLRMQSIGKKRLNKAMSRPGTIGFRTMELSADGLRQQTLVSDQIVTNQFVAWNFISNIKENKNYLIILFDDTWHLYWVVPKRSFASTEEENQFRNFLLSQMQFFQR